MRLYFIRHGQTVNNQQGILTGHDDVMLTENGLQQARDARAKLEGIKFDAVFSSDLTRAIDTQKIMLPDCTAVTTPLLREYDLGALVGKTFDENVLVYGECVRESFRVGNYKEFGGECFDDVKLRLEKFLENVIDKDYQNVAVFAHSGLCKAMLSLVMGSKISTYCDNCAINVFEYIDGCYKLVKWNN